MLKITLEQWRMFKAVVTHGGFNQASQAIHKSQSSIHNAVNKIERNLNLKLFRIEGRKTVLTEAGELMLRRADFLLDEAAKIEAIGLTMGDGVESKLVLAVDEIFPQHILYEALDATSKEFPFLRIELKESILSGADELVRNLDADIAISPLPLTGGFTEELCQLRFVAVANPEHPLHKIDRLLKPEDLKAHRHIVVSDSGTQNRMDSGWLEAEQRWSVTHLRTSVDMIANGLGFAWLPCSAIMHEIKAGRIKPLEMEHGGTRTAKLNLVFKDGDRLGPAARCFIGELRYRTMDLATSESIEFPDCF